MKVNLLSLIVHSSPIHNEFQLTANTAALEKFLRIKVAFMRPPYGSYNDRVLQVAAAHNQSAIIWDLEYIFLSPKVGLGWEWGHHMIYMWYLWQEPLFFKLLYQYQVIREKLFVTA